ncbi:hypothetical protein EB796_009492 [Bugula neritina]|uniref:Uncharacterized protein n=1 Tax=Bugula neritina TaxID=10212 RepID=A0A7J7K1Z2_BUGNE|nr:hypothetical protein EB796_009492 [Bugula neritina]
MRVLTIQNVSGDTVLHIAADKAQSDIVKHILDLVPADELFKLISIQNENKETTVHQAFNQDKTMETAKLFIDCLPAADYLKLLSMQNCYGETIAHVAACINGPIQQWIFYLVQDQEGNTVIQFATSLGHTDIVKCVIDSVPSADLWKLLSIQNQQDETTLHISVNSNNMETLPCLVESVETTELHTLLLTQDIYGDTAIHSVAYGGHVDMLDKLSLQQK